DDQTINLQLPTSLGAKMSQLQVTVDGEKSAPLAVQVFELAPAIFSNGILNADSSINSDSNAASMGSELQIFSPGLIGAVPRPVLVKLHDRNLTPVFAGPAPGLVGVNQVNVMVPDDLPAMTTEVVVCGFSA